MLDFNDSCSTALLSSTYSFSCKSLFLVCLKFVLLHSTVSLSIKNSIKNKNVLAFLLVISRKLAL